MSEQVLTSPGYRKATIFPIGAKGAGMEIIAHHTVGAAASDMQYLVRYECCGKEGILNQVQVLARIRSNSERCNECRLQLAKQRTAARIGDIEAMRKEKAKLRAKHNLGHYAKTRIKQISAAQKAAVSMAWK